MLRAAHTVALLFPVVVAGVAAAQPQGSSETAWGLSTTTFETPGGPVTVHLPADLAAGDTLSGTVFAEPR
jgi:hypothetical protein